MPHPEKKLLLYCLGAFLPWITLTGCMVGPDFHSPAKPSSRHYTASPPPSQTAGKPQKLVAGRPVPKEWWKQFHNPTLNRLIATGLAHNPGLDAAKATLVQAQETLNAEVGSALYPDITGQLSATRERYPGASLGRPGADSTFNLYNATVNVSYTLDFFGAARRQLESLGATVDYQLFQEEAARLTLAGNIATTAITIASLRDQIAATHALISAEESQLKIIQHQRTLGGASETDVLLQQSHLAEAKATLPPLQLLLDKNTHALAVLTGHPPSDIPTPSLNLRQLALPSRLPLTLPSTALQTRPDIKAAEAQLHAANAQIGVATANLLPQFTITGYGGYESNTPSRLFHAGSDAWSLGAALMQPIFNGGSLRATRRAVIATRNQIAAQYQQTVLQALQNVADTLRAIQHDAATLQAYTAARRAAFAARTISREQYQLGGTSYLSVLSAETAFQQALLAEIVAHATRFTDTVALYVALGGSGGAEHG